MKKIKFNHIKWTVVKDDLIKLIVYTILLGWIFVSFICVLGELLYGDSLLLAALFGFFTLQGIKAYVNGGKKRKR